MKDRLLPPALALALGLGIAVAALPNPAAAQYYCGYYGCAASPFAYLAPFLAYGLFHHKHHHHDYGYEGYGGSFYGGRVERPYGGLFAGRHEVGRFGGGHPGAGFGSGAPRAAVNFGGHAGELHAAHVGGAHAAGGGHEKHH